MTGDAEAARAEKATRHAERVLRDNDDVVSPRTIDAYEVAADAWEEAGDRLRAEALRTFAGTLRAVFDAMWRSCTAMLDDEWPCGCCCHEHTYGGCPARLWGGCRGQGVDDRDEYTQWAAHYERFHGMSRDAFDGRE